MRKSLWFMLAVLFVAIGPPDARANDSVVTLNVSGTTYRLRFFARS